MKQVQFDMRTTKAFYPPKPQKKKKKKKKKQLHQIRKVPGIEFSKNFRSVNWGPFGSKTSTQTFYHFFSILSLYAAVTSCKK